MENPPTNHNANPTPNSTTTRCEFYQAPNPSLLKFHDLAFLVSGVIGFGVLVLIQLLIGTSKSSNIIASLITGYGVCLLGGLIKSVVLEHYFPNAHQEEHGCRDYECEKGWFDVVVLLILALVSACTTYLCIEIAFFLTNSKRLTTFTFEGLFSDMLLVFEFGFHVSEFGRYIQHNEYAKSIIKMMSSHGRVCDDIEMGSNAPKVGNNQE